jgi:hypothetical protein
MEIPMRAIKIFAGIKINFGFFVPNLVIWSNGYPLTTRDLEEKKHLFI